MTEQTLPMNKTELARKIQSLDGLSNEEKTELLRLIRGHKKYGLVWEEFDEDVYERMRKELPVLTERNDDKVHSIVSDDPAAPNHIIIEGDNLAALMELSYTHAGKIDVIYIDPPYNTGKEFVYNDKIVDSDNAFRHSRWAAFMHRRLRLVRNLLKPGGLIFISIDFHELPNLMLIGNEIFGESNFIANITVKGNPRGRQSSSYFAQVDDSLVVYRNSPAAELQGLLISGELSKKRFNKVDDSGRPFEEWELRKRGADARRVDSPNLWFPIYYDKVTKTLSTSPVGKNDIVITPKLSTGEDGRWRWSRAKVEADKDSLYVRRTRGGYNVFERKYPESKSRQLAPTIWDFSEVNTELGTKLLKEILGKDVPFDYPKPAGLIELILKLVKNQNAIVLDFFAGSGTTLHAVMALNAADGGKRTCILCTNNENGICENLTYERNRRVIEGYTTPGGEKMAGLTANNLRYFKTEYLPRERSVKNMRRLVKEATGLLCVRNNIYSEAAFCGNKLKSEVARYFESADDRMLVIYEERSVQFIAALIAKKYTGSRIKVYVFSHGSYAYEDEFAEVLDHVTLCALPQAIYDAYVNVLPDLKPVFLVDDLVEDIAETEAAETAEAENAGTPTLLTDKEQGDK